MKKSKLAKKAKHRKVVARKAPRKVVRKVAKKRAVRKATPMAQVATRAETSVAPSDGAPPGSHLDAPAAGPHPGEGHQSVVRSEVKR